MIQAVPVSQKRLAAVLVLLVLVSLAWLFRDSLSEGGIWVDSFVQREGGWGLFFLLVFVGFCAQMIDGALGMAYGVSSTTMLLSLGIPPAAASAGVHVAEVFTTGVSGLSHLSMGNVSKKLVLSLMLPGMIGAAAGAYLLSNIDGNMIKPFVAVYLAVMGVIIIRKSIVRKVENTKNRSVAPLAVIGGFIDSVGGGGWGPVVASSLIGRGRHPRFAVGSVNLAEFFIAAVSAGTFSLFMDMTKYSLVVAGLILGGVMAAPLAAWVCRKIKPLVLMRVVGVVIILLSLRTFLLVIQ